MPSTLLTVAAAPAHERAALEGILAFLVTHQIPTGYAKKIFDEFGFYAVDALRRAFGPGAVKRGTPP